MKVTDLIGVLFMVMTHHVWAGEIVLRDLDCKLVFPGKGTVGVIDGEKSEYTCVTRNNEAICNYKNLKTGVTQGEPNTYEVITLNGAQIWSSQSGNIKVFINEEWGNTSMGWYS